MTMPEQLETPPVPLRVPGAINQPRHSLEEMARLGQQVYERDVRPHLKPEHDGLYLAVDVEGRGWEIGTDEDAVVERLVNRIPDAQVSLQRAGRRPAGMRRFEIGYWE